MDFKLDLRSPMPLHAQIEVYLRDLVQRKEYINGDHFLPKETALSQSLGVSRNTIRQAINKLVQEGIIDRKKGVGSKVVTKNTSARLDNWISFTEEMRNKGIEVVNYLLKASLVAANPTVCRVFSIESDKHVWCLEKIIGSESAKFLYSVSYFHPRVGINGREDFSQPLYELLEKTHNVVVAISKEKLKAIMPDTTISNFLDLNENTPLLMRERLVCDLGDRPVEYNIVYYNTEYFSYDIDIKREV